MMPRARRASPSRARRALAAAGLLALLASAASARAEPPDPRKLRHLLRYVAADYRYAVQDGQVVSQAEHDEHRALLAEARVMAPKLAREELAAAQAIEKALSLVEQRAPEADVVRALRAAEAVVVRAFRLSDRPENAPDLERGNLLYQEHCATCHGAKGHADTARAKSLSPPPVDFHDPARGDATSPFRVYGAVEFGIDGTAMVPFTFLSEKDRWNLAFVVTGLRHVDEPRSGRAPALALSELASATDGELLDQLYAAGARGSDLTTMLAALREDPTGTRNPDRARPRLLGARAEWDEARLRFTWGDAWRWDDIRGARQALLRGLHQGFDPARAHLSLAAPDATAELEQRAVLALGLATGRTETDVFDAAVSDLLRATTRADLVASETGRRAPFTRAIGAAWASFVQIGPAWLAFAAARARRRNWMSGALAVTATLATVVWLGTCLLPDTGSGRKRLLAASLAAAATALLAVIAAMVRRAHRARAGALATLVLAAAAAVAAGQSVHTAQLAGLLPAHALGSKTLLFPLANPTWEACAAQAACLLVGLAAFARRTTRQPRPA